MQHSIKDLLATSAPTFSFEFFPPKTDEGERTLWQAITELEPLNPTFVDVTYGAGGSTQDRTLSIVKRIVAETSLTVVAHLTCVGATREEVDEVARRYWAAGVRHVVALRGDPPAGQDEWRKAEGGLEYSRELVELIGADYDFAIGGACFPETHIHASSPEDDLRYLKEKVDAGAQFLITQLFFDNAYYYDFVERARGAGIDVPIIPGIMPVTNFRQIKRITGMCGATTLAELERALAEREEDGDAVKDVGVAYATLQCSELLARGAPGIHFYTLNRSPGTRAVLAALRASRPWERAEPGAASRATA